MLERLAEVDWSREAQPTWNAPDEIVRALRAIAEATAESRDDAYSRMLYALGNNHAGTYFPIVLQVVPFLGEILRDGSEAARLVTLDVLVDLLGSFAPEAGYEVIATPDGDRSLRDLLKERCHALRGQVERLLASRAERKLAEEVLEFLSE